ncbi:MAG: putative OPT family oligopeptide transporter [Limisphaerales bacterium]|jgi:putative OPT family oligopeptide transporter
MREITVRSIIISVFLTAALAGANAYLGLKIGMTVSASIPAAVISMGILTALRGRNKGTNILENNMVQTAASAGESLAAGVIFTIPALILLGYWTEFKYWQVALISGLGGLLGVLFCIPLRRAFIVDSKELKFPEGLATAEVLKEGEKGGSGAKTIAIGAAIGAVFKFLQSGLHIWGEALEGAKVVAGKWLGYAGTNLSPALLGVGYIVGLNIGSLVLIGGLISWAIGIPLYAMLHESEVIGDATIGAMMAEDPANAAWIIWSEKIRYLGVGAMATGGVFALLNLWRPVLNGIKSGIAVYKKMGASDESIDREQQDIPMPWVLGAIGALTIPLFFYYWGIIDKPVVAFVMTLVMLVAGFVFSSVAAYMAGLVGSTNNPISGVTIATLLFTSFVLLFLMGKSELAPAAAILVGSVVCCAAAIAGDTLQDLKCGNLVNATPWKQQVMEFFGVIIGAITIPPVLMLLHKAYTIGSEQLAAPQASLMAAVTRGILDPNSAGLPWGLVGIGAGIALVIIVIDKILELKKAPFRAPVLAVAVGIYLPIELAGPIFAGGLLSHYIKTRAAKRARTNPDADGGVLVASGFITGEALMGILVAGIIVACSESPGLDAARKTIVTWCETNFASSGPWLGFAALVAVGIYLFQEASKKRAE